MLGFQGFGNVGDEAILEGIEVAAAGVMDVKVLLIGKDAPVPAFAGARRISPWHLWPSVEALRALRHLDALAISGGGLVNDYWRTLIPRYVAWVVAARLLGLRVIWLGVGVGPIRSRVLRAIAGLGLGLSSLVTVRDTYSADWVRACPRAPEPSLIPDPAFFNHPEPRRGGDGLALILRPPAPGSEDQRDRVLGEMSALAVDRAAEGWAVHIVSMHPVADDSFIDELVRRIEFDGGPTPSVEVLPLGASAAIGRLARFDAIVTMRLHGLILGALAGVPGVPIVYDAKVGEAATALGLDDVEIPLGELTSERVLRAVEVLGSEDRRAAVRARLDGIGAGLPGVKDLLRQALDRSGRTGPPGD